MLTIGQLAARADVSSDTLRYYERELLLTPSSRTESGYRLYGADAVRRVRFIKEAQCCGFTLGEIRELLALRSSELACCGDVRSLALEKKLQLENKIRAMQAMSKALDHLVTDCSEAENPVDECPILAALEQAAGTVR